MTSNVFTDTVFANPSWPDGAILLDAAGHIIQLSPKAAQVLGFSLDRVRHKSAHAVLCAHLSEQEHEAAQCPLICFAGDPLRTYSATWVGGDGNYLGVDYRVIPFIHESLGETMVICFHENPNKQHNQAALEKFAQYVGYNPTAIAEFDEEGQMIFANPAMQEAVLAFGFDDNGRSNVQPTELEESCARVCTSQQCLHNIDVPLEEHYLSWHLFPVQSQGTRTVIGFLFDISDVKLVEQRIEREKAEARRDFFAKMVHELRTPLNAIIGFSQVLIRRNKETLAERDFNHLKAIRVAGLQLNDMVTDTLDVSKIEAGKMSLELSQFCLQELLSTIDDQMSTLAELKSLEFEMTCPEDVCLYSDLKKVRQILVNLISNAIKYTSQGQVNVVICEGQNETGLEQIEICVCDTGMGIPEDQLGSLFTNYQQVSDSQNRNIQGTGLGLALVSELVKMLQGSIRVSSEYRKGSEFWVTLPTSLSAQD